MALRGIRVLDMGRILAAPYCTMILGDMGAEVIKIERPGSGDDTRAWGPPFKEGEATYFLAVNRNKKSVTVDIACDEGRELILDLARHSDVFIENFLPGKLDALGLGYEDLEAVNPGLVYCSVSGFGPDGPYAGRAGYDVIAAGMYGLLSITGPADGAPAKPGVALTDLTTGLYAHGAILAALLQRERCGGRGQRVDCSLMESQLASLANIGANTLIAGTETHRWGTAHESIVPYQAFSAADGDMVVGALNDGQFRKLARAVGRPELAADARFATNRDRVAHRDVLVGLLSDEFARRPKQEWLDALAAENLPSGPVNSVAEAFADPQAQHRGMVQTVQHPLIGDLRLCGPAVKFAGEGAAAAGETLPPPLLGEHTEEVLTGLLGYTEERVGGLRSRGVV